MPAVLAALALAGCSLAPVQPSTPALPAQWKSAPPEPGFSSTEHARHWQAGQWWALWDDPVLSALVQRANAANQTLAVALANVAQAQAALAGQRAGLFPTLGVGVSAQRSGGDERQATGSAAANLNASWAPDFWGRVSEAVRAQSASVQASQADLAAARLSVQGALAKAYFAVREADVELALLDETIAGYERSATITQNRYDVGSAARTDALQAQATLANARASRAALVRTRESQVNAMALLLGSTPAEFSLPPVQNVQATVQAVGTQDGGAQAVGTQDRGAQVKEAQNGRAQTDGAQADWRPTLPSVPVQLPSSLLLRRPDVASAERAVAAANAQIGVARAAYFPDISLSASVGGGASSLSRLVSAPALAWSLGLSVVQSLFDAGARSAQVDASRAAYDAAVARYRQAALAAIGEVEDQLLALDTLAEQMEQTRQSAQIAQQVERQQMNRYQAGLADYTQVVSAQASAINARRTLLQLQLQRQQAVVALIQALGGGWQADWQAPAADGNAASDKAAAANANAAN